MFFHESESTAREHPDLAPVIEGVDRRLSGVRSPSPLRPTDFSYSIEGDDNQVESVFDLLARAGVLRVEEIVECERCQTLVSADAFRHAVADEDPLDCTRCGSTFPRRSRIGVVYRLSQSALDRVAAKAPACDARLAADRTGSDTEEPLSQRAREALVAMLDLNAIDSDRRQSTEAIAAKASGGDANALKVVMSELKSRDLIDTRTGRGGGCWLTERGRARATKLRDGNGNPAPV